MKLSAVVLAVVTLGGTAFGADPALLKLVPPNATVVAGLNVTNARLSPLGQFLLARLPGNMSELSSTIGFDPLQDVTEALAAGTPNSGGLIGMKGTFAPEKLTSYLGSLQNGPVYTVQTYAGATLITITGKDGKDAGLAFLGATEAVAGDLASVKGALDRSASGGALDASFTAQINTLSLTEDAWILSTVSPASLVPAPAAQNDTPNPLAQASQFLAAVTSLSGGVKFGETVPVNLNLVANSPQNAEALANVVKFIAGMAVSGAGQSNTPQASALDWLKSLQVSTTGTKVDVSLAIPESQIEALIGTAKKPAAAARKGN